MFYSYQLIFKISSEQQTRIININSTNDTSCNQSGNSIILQQLCLKITNSVCSLLLHLQGRLWGWVIGVSRDQKLVVIFFMNNTIRNAAARGNKCSYGYSMWKKVPPTGISPLIRCFKGTDVNGWSNLIFMKF